MKRRRLCNIVLALLLSTAAFAQQAVAEVTDTEVVPADTNVVVIVDTIVASTDTAELAIARRERKEIYQGTTVKLDILSPFVGKRIERLEDTALRGRGECTVGRSVLSDV